MKGDAKAVFAPVEDESEATEAAEEGAESSDSDALLGSAFDAIQDGDREGFIRLVKAALKD